MNAQIIGGVVLLGCVVLVVWIDLSFRHGVEVDADERPVAQQGTADHSAAVTPGLHGPTPDQLRIMRELQERTGSEVVWVDGIGPCESLDLLDLMKRRSAEDPAALRTRLDNGDDE